MCPNGNASCIGDDAKSPSEFTKRGFMNMITIDVHCQFVTKKALSVVLEF